MNRDDTIIFAAGTEQPQSFAARWWEVLLIILVFFAIAGDPAPRVNEAHYLGRLKHLWDPSWCAGDLFFESPEAHGVFAWTFGWVTKWLSLTATAWVGCILEWALLAWTWQRLSWRIVPVPLAAVLTAALWVVLIEVANLAGEWVVGGVEAKCFAYVFVLIALRAMVDRRWNQVWIALGAASAFHVLVGGWSMVVCGGIWVVEQWRAHANVRNSYASALSMLPGLALGGTLSLLGLGPALALNWHQPPDVVAAANRIYVFERLPHHLSPLTLPPAELATRLVPHGLLILCLWGFSRANRSRVDDRNHALRMVNAYAWGAIALAAIGFTIEILLWNRPQLAASLLRLYWFRLTDVAVPLAVALEAGALLVAGVSRRKPWAVWALAGALAVALWHVGTKTTDRWLNPRPPADSAMQDPSAWSDVCDWISANTPRESLFLTPRLASTFKWRTGRAEIATRKDMPQDARSMVAWFDRLQDIFYFQLSDGAEPFNSIGELGTERAVALARKYGASYIVSDQDHPLALKAIYPNHQYPNDEYVVYAIDE